VGDRRGLEAYSLLEAAARRHGCRLRVAITDECGREEGDVLADLEFLPPEARQTVLEDWRQRPGSIQARIMSPGPTTVGTLIAAARDVRAVLDAVRTGNLNAFSAAALIRGHRPHLLLGQPESEWLEVKSEPYQVSSSDKRTATLSKLELAQDVAALANGRVSALLVVGLKTNGRENSDIIEAVTPVKPKLIDPRQYRNIIDQRVYPTIQGLNVEPVDLDSGRLLIIEMPAQPEELKPFLVHGAIIGQRAAGTYIRVVQRRGEDSIPTTAAQIHSSIAVGRAFLRGDMPVEF
jgi:Putative DNA-binding domain